LTIEAILFDFNGVIIDDEPVHCDAWRAALAPFDLTFTDEEYYGPLLGIPDTYFLDHLLKMRGVSLAPRTAAELLNEKRSLYDQLVRRRNVDPPGLAAFVRDAAAHVPVAVVSGALRQEIEYHLQRLELAGIFKAIVAAGEYQAAKPDPEPYLVGLRALSQATGKTYAPGAVLTVEDSGHGVASARAAGMPVLGYAGRIAPEVLHGSFAVIYDFSLLTFEILEQMFTAYFL